MTKIDWKKYVDSIYLLTYILNKDNEINRNEELNRVNLNDSDIFYEVRQFPTPLYDKLYESFYDNAATLEKTKYFNMLMGHYRCIKMAYLNGDEYTLILEEDFRFLKSKEQISNILDETIPKFKKIHGPAIFLGSSSYMLDGIWMTGIDESINYNNLYEIFDNFIVICAGTTFNIYNRDAMKCLIDYVENFNFSVIDEYHKIYPSNCKLFILNKKICLQQGWIELSYNTCIDYNMLKPTNEQLERIKKYISWRINGEEIYNQLINYWNIN